MDKINFKNKFVAIKMHFGEPGNVAYLRPNYAKVVVDFVKERGGKPFLTDCNTLYVGRRKEALEHLTAAYENGFSPFSTGCHGRCVFLDIAEAAQHAHCGNDALLGDKTGKRRSNRLPGAEAERRKDPGNGPADDGQETGFCVHKPKYAVLNTEAAEEPHGLCSLSKLGQWLRKIAYI